MHEEDLSDAFTFVGERDDVVTMARKPKPKEEKKYATSVYLSTSSAEKLNELIFLRKKRQQRPTVTGLFSEGLDLLYEQEMAALEKEMEDSDI